MEKNKKLYTVNFILACIIVLLIGLLISMYRENDRIKAEKDGVIAEKDGVIAEFDELQQKYDDLNESKSTMVDRALRATVMQSISRSWHKLEMLTDDEYRELREECLEYAYNATVLFSVSSHAENEDIGYLVSELYNMALNGELYLSETGVDLGIEISQYFGSNAYEDVERLENICEKLRNREKFEG